MEALSRLPVTWDHKPARTDSFRSSIRSFKRSDVIFAQMRVEACNSARGFEKQPTVDDEYICVAAQIDGRQRFRQGRKELAVEAGEVFVWNAQLPGMSECGDGLEGRTCMIPYSMIRRKIGDPGNFFGKKALKNNPVTRILHSNIVALHEVVHEIEDACIPQMISSIMDMLSCSLGLDEGDFGGSKYQREIFNRLVRYIHDNLEDESLSVGTAAEALSIGTRTVQQVFMLAGTSFGAYLREQRLREAAQALASPAFANISVTEIALRFGFYDLSHFSRAFKQHFGNSPRLYRKL